MNPKPAPLFRNEFFGAPYKVGGKSKEEGFDCFSFIYYLYEKMGFDMPDGIDGVSATDYVDLWESDEEAAKEVMWNYINSFSDLVPVGSMMLGDITILKVEDNFLYPGVYMGNSLVGLSEVDRGVVVYKLDIFELVAVRRWIGNGR